MIRVLFVCLGNICRSPMAEAVFANLVREAGLENEIETDSAGTGDWHVGSPAHPGTMAMLLENGIQYEGKGRTIVRSDLDEFDYIITMDDDNLDNVRRLGKGRAQIAPLLSFAPQTGRMEVPDPYFDGGFDGVYDLICEGCRGLLKAIEKQLATDEHR